MGATVKVWDGSTAHTTVNSIWDGAAAKLLAAPLLPIGNGGGGGGGGGGTPSYGVFYAMPDDIRTHTKKVWAHYFGPYPRSLGNEATAATTSYATYFNDYTQVTSNPNNATFGSYFRDAPLFRAPLVNDWQVQDCKFDIIAAMNAGIDGFMCDLLGLSGSNYNNYEYLKTALRQLRQTDPKYNSFYVIAQIDANGSTAKASTSTAGDYVATFNDTAYHLPDGRMVWSCFLVESSNVSLAWWQGVADYLTNTKGITNAFVGVANNWNASVNYDSVQYGAGAWGFGADPAAINAASDQASAAHARGKIYMHPATSQDTRPRNQLFDESCNTEALRATWDKAQAQATGATDMVLIPTWSDFSEAPMAPSMQKGFCYLDLTGYYAIRWKTGVFPDILKDQIYLSHRDELYGANQTAATITGPETLPMQHWQRGVTISAVRNTVEVLSFLTAPADITVTVGGTNTTYTAPAGMNAHLVPLAVGAAPSAVAKRSGAVIAQVTSVVAVSNSVAADDAGYYCVTSGDRGTAGQMRPNMT